MTSENESKAFPDVFTAGTDCGLKCQAAKNAVTDEELEKDSLKKSLLLRLVVSQG